MPLLCLFLFGFTGRRGAVHYRMGNTAICVKRASLWQTDFGWKLSLFADRRNRRFAPKPKANGERIFDRNRWLTPTGVYEYVGGGNGDLY